jgi:ribosomal protein S18 acetylase RimI-like enzyme
VNPQLPRVLLSRVEDAGLNAAAPPTQWWVDGWLVRAWPGKARRARCVHALMPGLMSLPERLAAAEALCVRQGVPLIFRITPFTQPPELEAALQACGFAPVDPTCVLVRPETARPPPSAVPAGLALQPLDGAEFVETVGALRGSPSAHRHGLALRLQHSPVPFRGLALRRAADGRVLACGQVAVEPPWAGLYDIYTHPEARNRGLARVLCEHLLALGATRGGHLAYLQVEAANEPALAVYRRLGFIEGYGYHYLERPA